MPGSQPLPCSSANVLSTCLAHPSSSAGSSVEPNLASSSPSRGVCMASSAWKSVSSSFAAMRESRANFRRSSPEKPPAGLRNSTGFTSSSASSSSSPNDSSVAMSLKEPCSAWASFSPPAAAPPSTAAVSFRLSSCHLTRPTSSSFCSCWVLLCTLSASSFGVCSSSAFSNRAGLSASSFCKRSSASSFGLPSFSSCFALSSSSFCWRSFSSSSNLSAATFLSLSSSSFCWRSFSSLSSLSASSIFNLSASARSFSSHSNLCASSS
mmetsp:Transcript_17350/g.40283  ORF Transcript_17350/g.40283 Transcript_17350/m.40283 type:complete len:266 (+) Transcript_17350:1038-1835(+)